MFTDDENPEGGEFHEVDGRRYSVVGNKVYVDGLFGWQLVEDEDEQASAGDQREVNGRTYSLVGDMIYCKNWLGGWDEITDIEERAEAGDLQEARGSTYSRVGNTIYRKGLFGWEEVTDEDEEADAGDQREVGNTTYSIVGDTVYRKDLFSWTIVDDDDECAEAGDHFERHNMTYSRVGDTIYKKELFGWTKLTEDLDDEEEEEEMEEPAPSFSQPEDQYTYISSQDTDHIGDAWTAKKLVEKPELEKQKQIAAYNSAAKKSVVIKILLSVLSIIGAYFLFSGPVWGPLSFIDFLISQLIIITIITFFDAGGINANSLAAAGAGYGIWIVFSKYGVESKQDPGFGTITEFLFGIPVYAILFGLGGLIIGWLTKLVIQSDKKN